METNRKSSTMRETSRGGGGGGGGDNGSFPSDFDNKRTISAETCLQQSAAIKRDGTFKYKENTGIPTKMTSIFTRLVSNKSLLIRVVAWN